VSPKEQLCNIGQMNGGWPVKRFDSNPRKRAVIAVLASVAVVVSAVAAAGATASRASAPPDSGFLNKSHAGSSITVLLPPWGQMPKSQLAKFTNATGIKVNLQTLDFDSIHDKIATSAAAGVAPADVTEMDWSWVGQFGAANWYTPLGDVLPKSTQSQFSSSFVYNGQQLAVPYNMDFRGLALNMTLLRKAGITSAPTTWSQLFADAQQLKAKGVVKYPVTIPFYVGECNSTVWYGLIKSGGGELLDTSGKPTFASLSSLGGQALLFEQKLYKSGLVPPGSISLNCNTANDLFAAGSAAIVLSAAPGSLSSWKTPAQSKVAKDDIVFAAAPGTNGHATGTFGLPEGMGIPKLSGKQQEAAMFIYWWQQLPQQLAAYEKMGDTPPQRAALTILGHQGKLQAAGAILKILPTVRPLFPNGTPPWYPQFSSDVATMVQSVILGKTKPAAGLARLADQTKTLASH
jgi:multiple sugar transport system substrate-binding protein